MSEEDLDYYVASYSESGFRGGLNWYRNIPYFLSDTEELKERKSVNLQSLSLVQKILSDG